VDSLRKEVSRARAQLEDLIRAACGGDLCVRVATEPSGTLPPLAGFTSCETWVERVKNPSVMEPGPLGFDQATVYVPRGGVITLVLYVEPSTCRAEMS